MKNSEKWIKISSVNYFLCLPVFSSINFGLSFIDFMCILISGAQTSAATGRLSKMKRVRPERGRKILNGHPS